YAAPPGSCAPSLHDALPISIGIGGFPHIQQDIAELVSYVEIEKALLRAAEADGAPNDEGVFLPKWDVLNAARNWYPTKVSPRLRSEEHTSELQSRENLVCRL